LLAHSKGDDNRPADAVEKLWRADPLKRLLDEDEWNPAVRAAESAIFELTEKVACRPPLKYIDSSPLALGTNRLSSRELHADVDGDRNYNRGAEEINSALHELMAADERVILIGEDLADPYGGAFKVTRGLSTEFPERVISTPIAEAGIVGVANGLALAGLRP